MRYKEFNRNSVLEKCINLFWKNGYRSCSINEIVSNTRVNRFSLYDEFQDKEGILFGALELYNERYINKIFERLNQNKPIRNVLVEFYMSFLSNNNSRPSGCFIIHTATELADNNIKIKKVLDNYLSELEERLESLLQSHPETKSNAKFYAKHLTGLFCTSMCFSVIQSHEERLSLINNGINVILKKNTNYAANS